MTAMIAMIALVGGCRPDFGAPVSLVASTRLLAVVAEPAEAAPGAEVSWSALVASPEGTVDQPGLDWGFCTQPKPLAENDVVGPACITIDAVEFVGATGPSLTAPIPADACRLFGPDLPPQGADDSPLRPRDPDATGGYYLPVRVALGGEVSFQLERLRCNLAGASLALAQEFAAAYTPNRNPVLAGLSSDVPLDAVPPGATVRLTAAWTADSAEPYPTVDVLAQSLVAHTESLRVSWYATAGAFAADSTGRAEGDPALSTDNTWTAPSEPGPVHGWAVLRDSRGGLAFTGWQATVR